MQKKLFVSAGFLYTPPMSDKNQTKLPYSAVKMLIKICRRAASVEGTEDEFHPEWWAVKCEPSDSRTLLMLLGLITCETWVSGDHYIPTNKGMKLYYGE